MKTNAKINVGHHVKNIHHVTKRTHELFKNSKICNYTNALLLILILSVAILATQMFLNNQNKIIPEAEIRFSELSKDKKILGSIMPASCESNPNVANDDGNFTGCATETCWNGTVITPAMGQSCIARPTQTCWDDTVITPSLGQSCPSQYCGADTGIYSGTMEGFEQIQVNKFNRCICNGGEAKKIRTNSIGISPTDPSTCSPVVTTVASNNMYKLKKDLMSFIPERAYAGPTGPICISGRYAFCSTAPAAPIVNIRFQ